MELVLEKLLGFAMVLTRISAFFMILPVFGWKSIPANIKIAMTILISIFFSMLIPLHITSGTINVLKVILLLANEALYGLALGLIATLLFTAVQFSGRFVERQMGLAMAQIMDPLTGERTQPLGSLLEMIFVILFLSANGHHLFLMVISRSYEAFPAGSIPSISILVGGVVQASSAMLMAGLKLAAPMLAAFLLLMVILAVLARIVPEMNILFISMPLRFGLGLFMVAIFLPLFNSFVSEFADLMGKLMPL